MMRNSSNISVYGTVLQKRVMNTLSANPTKWSNALKQFVGFCRRTVLSVCDYFVGLEFKGLT